MNSKMFGVFTPGVDLLKPVEKFMDELFPEDAHLRANGRLFISVTNADTKENELISEFSSRENLIQVALVILIAGDNVWIMYSSCFWPLFNEHSNSIKFHCSESNQHVN